MSGSGLNPFDMNLSPSLWMGNLDEDMNEQFIKQAFAHYGEKVVTVKIMKSRTPGQVPFCFVEFEDVEQARHALNKLNGRIIPGVHPTKLFKLNPASFGKEHQLLPEFSLHIGDLSSDVDDYTLYCAFAKNYPSVRGAKVVFDSNGKSRGFGFVRFSEEADQQRALIEMQHMTGIGRRPIRVGLAAPKRGHGDYRSHDGPSSSYPAPSSYSTSYSHHPPPPHGSGSYYSWGGYYHYTQNYQGHPPASHEYSSDMQVPPGAEDLEVLEDPCLEVNVTKENREFMESSESFFEALDRSRWFAIDNVMCEQPV